MSQNTFTFSAVPKNLAELKALPEAQLQSPYGTAALAVLALCNYKENVQATLEMLDYLKGPKPLTPFDKQFLRDRLQGKEYKPYSYFNGATPENNYTPAEPLTITILDGAPSIQEEGYAKLMAKSSGADSPRQIVVRSKPSSGEWFLWEQFLLPDIRTPKAQDPWA